MPHGKRKRLNFRKGAAAKAAPGAEAKGDDVKVPIEVEGEEPKNSVSADEVGGQQGKTNAEKTHAHSGGEGAGQEKREGKHDGEMAEKKAASSTGDDIDDEAAMVEAAIRAGEKAAEEDFKSDAEKVRRERDRLAKKLADTDDDIAKAKAAAKTAEDRLARLQADWDNYRRRTATERLAERDLANEKLIKSLLPVIDDMERAITHANAAADDDANLKQFSDGIQAVHAKLLDVLAKDGLGVINPAGEPFDPMRQQAVGRVEDQNDFTDTVRDVYQPGYEMAGKVLRPAMVTVTYGGKTRPVEKVEADSDAGAKKEPNAEAKGDEPSKEDVPTSKREGADGPDPDGSASAGNKE